MKFSNYIFRFLRNILPSPLSLALLLTMLVFIISIFTCEPQNNNSRLATVFEMWQTGLWSSGGLVFLVQMMLMLVLGHVLALSPIIDKIINALVVFAKNPKQIVGIVALATLLVSWINWGLGLIFGAILCRKIGEFAQQNQIKINYPLIGASGYVGLMFWHGGLSGSALVKVAEKGHLASLLPNANLPDLISFNETVFTTGNLLVSLLVLILVPLVLMKFAKTNVSVPTGLVGSSIKRDTSSVSFAAERLDQSKVFGSLIGVLILIGLIFSFVTSQQGWAFINPNSINLILFGMIFLCHKSVHNVLIAVESAITDGAGILIQFPLYFGIMALMKEAHLIEYLASFFVSISNETTFPIWAFISSGMVNLFVPSGGGQWMVQGPIILEACIQLGIPLQKGIMALAYGDQITNMLQPFWALPLLGITKLKAQEILPYTMVALVVGSVIYLLGLMFFI